MSTDADVFQAAVDAFYAVARLSRGFERLDNGMEALGAFAEVLLEGQSKWTEQNINSHVVIGDERWVDGWQRGYLRASLDAERYPEMLLNYAKKYGEKLAEMKAQLIAEQEARLRIESDEALINVGR